MRVGLLSLFFRVAAAEHHGCKAITFLNFWHLRDAQEENNKKQARQNNGA